MSGRRIVVFVAGAVMAADVVPGEDQVDLVASIATPVGEQHSVVTVEVTAACLTKLDGTSKGGIVFAISDQLGIPMRFVGTGEQPEDLAPFSAEAFVGALFR
ncbi:MAG: hypothetical protein IIC26_01935 [Chloroflexi bacterium]|nr:hypothetical protein [Chloroflexota bacterium]